MASDTIINNLNSVIGTKNEIAGIIRENGINPGTTFSDYPGMLRTIIGSGGSASGDEIISYISSYLGAYNYIDQTKLSANSYITSTDIPTIDENIIPKETDSYTLGDSSYYYHTLYANRIQGASTINLRTGGNNRLTVSSSAFRPMQQNYNLGSSDYPFATGYISYIYTDNAYTNRYNFNYSTWIGSDSNYEFHIGVNNQKRFQCNMYQFYQITNPDSSSLGVNNYPWAYTYTKFLIGQNAYISNSTYLPVNTYWYDGTTYHWLGSLFN